MTGPVTVTQQTFRSDVIDAETPVLVDFWAGWCQPCAKMEPTIEKIAADYDGRATVAKVDVEQERGLAAMFQIMSIPAIAIFHHGKKVVELHGQQSEADLTAALDSVISG